MDGYYNDPEATAAASRLGWQHTGDIGNIDDEGYLFIVDRLKDMIITGGFNVYSAEVEQALMQHPAVRDCAVIGLPDEKWGERVEAVIELKPGEVVAGPELIAFVKGQIGSVKAPKQITVWDQLPRSRVGKILKNDVRADLLGG
jgi:acyl-CoA synthetase (AMP-forming)/AMP-acid ligase II